VHGQQHAVEHRKADRAGVQGVGRDGGQMVMVIRPIRRARGCNSNAVAGVMRCRVRRQAAKHQQVVVRRGVVGAGQLRVQQVGHVQPDQARARPALQRLLQQVLGCDELIALAGDPQETTGRQTLRQADELLATVRLEMDRLHGPQAARSLRAASSAK